VAEGQHGLVDYVSYLIHDTIDTREVTIALLQIHSKLCHIVSLIPAVFEHTYL
jgi:hypothetical protein